MCLCVFLLLSLSLSPHSAHEAIGWRVPYPWVGGLADEIPRDKTPPSRAYLKLEEALRLFGRAPGSKDVCVDLGSAPGGTYSS